MGFGIEAEHSLAAARAPSPHKVPSDDSTATSGGTAETDPSSSGTNEFNNAPSLHAHSSMGSNASFVSARSSSSPRDQDSAKACLGAHPDPGVTDLDHFHAAARIQMLTARGHFTKVRGLADCCRDDGKVELYRRCAEDGAEEELVVVKRILTSRVHYNTGKERCERTVHRNRCPRDSEDCLNEIGVYCLLAQQEDLPEFILNMHTVFQSGVDVWLVLEHADGGDLFGVIQQSMQSQASGGTISMLRLRLWTWQLLQAVGYLHRHRVGHRDISMENVLLRGETVKLMDFGQAVETHSAAGLPLRYFSAVGKPYYRSPESYVPTQAEVRVIAPSDCLPGEVAFTPTISGDHLCEVLLPKTAVLGQECFAAPFGYTVTPVDVFACGVCLFIMATGMPPWRQAVPSDNHFAYAREQGIKGLLQAWQKILPGKVEELLSAMMTWDPKQRLSVDACLAQPWLEPLSGSPVPVHPKAAVLPAVVNSEADDLARLLQGDCGAARESEVYPDAMHTSLATWSGEIGMTGFSADFYCRPEACRGATSSVDAASQQPNAFGGGALLSAGDFYSDLGGGCESNHLDSSPSTTDQKPSRNVLPESLFSSCLPKHAVGLAPVPLERFTDAEAVRSAPSDASFTFEPSTLHVNGITAADVGNHLLDFLATVAGATVTKVNIRKYSIKAHVAEDGGNACALKVRIYGEGCRKHAVEFQRRGGDAVALHLLFHRASGYLDCLNRSLAPTESQESEPSRQMFGGEVQLTSLRDWTDPGVKGLLKRTRRRSFDRKSLGPVTPVRAPAIPRPVAGGGPRRSPSVGCHQARRNVRSA